MDFMTRLCACMVFGEVGTNGTLGGGEQPEANLQSVSKANTFRLYVAANLLISGEGRSGAQAKA